MYFSHNPPCNQFYIRAHLCEALVTAPTGLVNKVELVNFIQYFMCFGDTKSIPTDWID